MSRITLVTGGASGIGHASAKRFADDGDIIVLADINEAALESVASEISETGAVVHTRVLDVADEDAVTSVFEEVTHNVGPIATLVNSAGLLENAATLPNVDMAAFDRLWDVNYRGTFLCCRAAAPIMAKAGGGSMILLGSINSFRPLPLPAYNPSKVAIKGLVELLAAELGPKRIRVNGIAPGYTLTPAIQARIDAGKRDPEAILASCALDHMITPEDIANAIAFLCSEQARSITGVMLPVDAGWLAATTYNTYPAVPDE